MKYPGRITEYNRQGRGKAVDTNLTCPLLKGFAEKCSYLFSDGVDITIHIGQYCLSKKHLDCPGYVVESKTEKS